MSRGRPANEPEGHGMPAVMGHPGGMMTDLRARLADARLYLCTDGRRATGDLVPFLDAVLANGVDIVQLREKGLEAGGEAALRLVVGRPRRRARGALAGD